MFIESLVSREELRQVHGLLHDVPWAPQHLACASFAEQRVCCFFIFVVGR